MNLSSLFSNPTISLIVLGAVLFVVGFCGCFGALLEVYVLLVIVCGNYDLIHTSEYYHNFYNAVRNVAWTSGAWGDSTCRLCLHRAGSGSYFNSMLPS